MKEQDKQQEFDNVFRNTFGDVEVIPSSKVWTKVEAELDGQRTRKPGAWIWFGLGFLLLFFGLGATFYLLSDSSPRTSFASSHPIAQSQPASKSGLVDTSNNVQRPISSSTENHSEKNSTGHDFSQPDQLRAKPEGHSPPVSPASATSPQTEHVSPNAKLVSEGNHAVNAAISSGVHVKHQESSPHLKNPVSEINTTTPVDSKIASDVQSQGKEKENLKPAQEQPVNEPVRKMTNTSVSEEKKKDETAGKSPASTPIPPAKTNEEKKGDTDFHSSASVKPTEMPAETNPDEGKKNTPAPPISSTISKKDSLALVKKDDSLKSQLSKPPVNTFTASTDSLSKALHLISISGFGSPELNLGGNSSSSSTQSTGSETRNPRISSGLKASIALRDKLEISIGCTYSQVNQEFAPQTLYFPRQLNGQPFIFNSSFGGMPVSASIMLSGFSPLAPPSITQFRIRYQYTQTVQYLNIPVEATLHFGHKRLGFFVSGGLNLQYAFSEKATLELLKENEIDRVDYSSLQVQKLNYTLQLGLGVDFKLTKHLGVYLEPNGRYNFLSQSTNTTIKSTNYFVGSAAGLKYTF